jgi:phosphoribosyl 1,2-cyclic phosphate phosphodiesterase
MGLRVEFLGTSGAFPTPRPLCGCAVCGQARALGVPYARNGPSVFVHGPDVLIDTPGEIVDQLNRSSVERIAACFYSHWHPDHTMGRHVFSILNHGFPVWPYGPRRTTPLYLPQQVAADTRRFLGMWDHLAYLEHQERVIEIHELTDGETVEIGGVRIRPLRLAPPQDFVYAFLFDDGDTRLLVVMDEIAGWEPPADAKGVDLAIVPMGIHEFHPLTGERRIASGHTVFEEEATFPQTLDIVETLGARRVVMTHIEETDGLGHDDLAALGERLRGEGVNLTFAFDTLIVDV